MVRTRWRVRSRTDCACVAREPAAPYIVGVLQGWRTEDERLVIRAEEALENLFTLSSFDELGIAAQIRALHPQGGEVPSANAGVEQTLPSGVHSARWLRVPSCVMRESVFDAMS